jgi:hypothetical protein
MDGGYPDFSLNPDPDTKLFFKLTNILTKITVWKIFFSNNNKNALYFFLGK